MDGLTKFDWLEPFRSDWPVSVAEMCARCGLTPGDAQSLFGSSDVVFFSHSFRTLTLSRLRVVNRFSPSTVRLESALATEGYRVGFAVPPGQAREFSPPRRGADWVLPVIVVTEMVLLPILVHIIGAYIKGGLDALSEKGHTEQDNVQVDICVIDGQSRVERWYRVRGTSTKVAAVLRSLVKKS